MTTSFATETTLTWALRAGMIGLPDNWHQMPGQCSERMTPTSSSTLPRTTPSPPSNSPQSTSRPSINSGWRRIGSRYMTCWTWRGRGWGRWLTITSWEGLSIKATWTLGATTNGMLQSLASSNTPTSFPVPTSSKTQVFSSPNPITTITPKSSLPPLPPAASSSSTLETLH